MPWVTTTAFSTHCLKNARFSLTFWLALAFVLILAGSHRGRLVRVYEVWSERGQVRVDLDEQAKRDFQDIFSFLEVCRDRDPQPRLNSER